MLMSSLRQCVYSSKFTIRNKCSNPVWPVILSGAVTPHLSTTGFPLPPGESISLSVSTSWSASLWGRTLCTQDSSGKFSCLTGDFASSTMAPSRGAPVPPATLAKFTLNGAGGLDLYEVSLVSGYNLPMMGASHGGTGGNCSSTGSAADLNEDCPVELRIIDESNEGVVVVACKSAYDGFGDAQYCCNAYDDGSSTFTSTGADYVITFCPDLSTGLNLIAKAATPVLEDTTAETKSCNTSPATATSDVVNVLPHYPRRLLVKPPNVNFYAPSSTSNENSWNLEKEDPSRPLAPIGRPPVHDSVPIGKSNEDDPPSPSMPIGKPDKEDPPRPPAPMSRPPIHDSVPIGKSNEEDPPSPPVPIGKSDKEDPPKPPAPIGRPPVHDSAPIDKSDKEDPPRPPAPIGKPPRP
ncbi:hypothetical protein SLEP1_g36685 [Rubroshorea leprosula]|uniref:Thaumatin-like protein n=1 Tax=Rubroshorea leprosula TaxID=152421 RepID=A0AAV5KSR6_9ROSI|nr:hypothetical protein SLEP1_g36685 [Rubroshorea leprosula]